MAAAEIDNADQNSMSAGVRTEWKRWNSWNNND